MFTPDFPKWVLRILPTFVGSGGGVLVGLGCHDPRKGLQYGLHSPYFNIDEKVLDVGTRLFGQVLTGYMEN